MSEGWIKLHRKLEDNPRYKDPDWLAVWVHFLFRATHAPRRAIWDGKNIELKPGQFISGRYQIAENTGVHASKVQRVLQIMKIDQQIDQQAGAKSSVFTVLNWEQYQQFDQQNDQPPISKRSASDQQAITTQELKNGRMEEVPPVVPRVPIELPVHFPKSERDAIAASMTSGAPNDFVRNAWNECASRGGTDRTGQVITSWARYIKGAYDRFVDYQKRNGNGHSSSTPPVKTMKTASVYDTL